MLETSTLIGSSTRRNMPAAQNHLPCNEFEQKLFLESKVRAQHHRFTLEAGQDQKDFLFRPHIVTSLGLGSLASEVQTNGRLVGVLRPKKA
jgi:hypothetical protein